MNLNNFLKTNRIDEYGTCPRITCADGFTLSVQAHGGSYCEPRPMFSTRTDWSEWDFTAVEVGFPSKKEDLLMPWVEDINNPTETVYGYVPVDVVEEVIEKHGGRL